MSEPDYRRLEALIDAETNNGQPERCEDPYSWRALKALRALPDSEAQTIADLGEWLIADRNAATDPLLLVEQLPCVTAAGLVDAAEALATNDGRALTPDDRRLVRLALAVGLLGGAVDRALSVGDRATADDLLRELRCLASGARWARANTELS